MPLDKTLDNPSLIKTIMADLVATWDVPLYDRTHKIEFEHGTTTGRRLIKVDGEVSGVPYIVMSYCHWSMTNLVIYFAVCV